MEQPLSEYDRRACFNLGSRPPEFRSVADRDFRDIQRSARCVREHGVDTIHRPDSADSKPFLRRLSETQQVCGHAWTKFKEASAYLSNSMVQQ